MNNNNDNLIGFCPDFIQSDGLPDYWTVDGDRKDNRLDLIIF